MRPIVGAVTKLRGLPTGNSPTTASGALTVESDPSVFNAGNGALMSGYTVGISVERVTPTGSAFAPRRWGALACCYLGVPK